MKKLLAMLLALVMVIGLMAGCGTSEAPADGGNDTPAAPAQNQGGSESNTPAGPQEFDEEPDEIVVAIMCFAPIDSAVQDRIENVVNEKMKAMINVVADFQWYDAVSYMTQIPMMISSGEQLDAMMFTPIPAAGYSAFMSQGQLQDISEYIDEYGADIKAELGADGLAATSRNGGIYGVGGMMAHQGGAAIIMRADVLEEIGMQDKFDSMTTWAEFEEIMKAAVAAGYPGMANSDAEGTVLAPQPFMTGPDSFADGVWVDVIGDGNQQVYADPADNTIKCYYASDKYKEALLRTAKWYDEGLIYKDAATTEEYADQQIKNGVGVAIVKTLEFGWEGSLPAACGYPVSVHFVDGCATQLATGSFTKFGWGVPVTSKEPEAAVKFINLLYSDNDVHNTLVWGEEGVDWVRAADGTAHYPDGKDGADYHLNDFLFGDILTVAPWDDDPTLRTQQRETNAQVKASKFIGFAIDNTPVVNQVTACQAVSNQYKKLLGAGAYGAAKAEAMWQEYMAALEKAGINEIIAEYQSQLDAWLATQ